MKTKRWTLWAATGMSVIVSSVAFAAGSAGTAATGTSTDTTVGTSAGATVGGTSGSGASTNLNGGAGVNAATAPGINAGGTSSSHMSSEGTANSNGVDSQNRATGLSRAEDRASAQSDLGGAQSTQDQSGATTKSTTKSKKTQRHHVRKPTSTTSPDSGS
ncbi:hypothetical protein WKR88_04710 [Trinickia caryophylli]|uniref:Uncharacterized protein n=1 Tax=Trinickia caryophylli TaxID=28094 RepID=A0A1X7FD34_TRICW|nr:hypothetical protein [Trinickia caryophylli]WQE10396.1 hypothetical protein U0034_11290 [Trinickia caryophylli]GLU34153.1 hypothetical protein Busp01_39950 [Trinickia caryophylli]SMF50079.1 hypothetical protein SAMN06295900_108211 [Trinickia caryophylli]